MTVGIRKTLGALLAFLGLLGVSEAVAQSPTPVELWVTNQHGEAPASPPDSLLVYAVGRQANGRPLLSLGKILSGDATKLRLPSGILVTADRVFVSNEPPKKDNKDDPACKSLPEVIALNEPSTPLPICGSITIYTRSAIEAACSPGNPATPTGFTNVAPSKVFEGDQTALFYPFGIAVNTAADELYVANQTRDANSGSINVYRLSKILTANGTNVNQPPLQVIRERVTGPTQIVFDAKNNELFVSNTYSGSVTVYRRNADATFTFIREIREKGAGTNPLQFVSGLARIDESVPGEPTDKLFVAHGLPPFNGLISIYGRGPDRDDPTPTPLRTIVGILNPNENERTLDEPTSLAFDSALTGNWLFVGNNPRTTSRGFISVFLSTDKTTETVDVTPQYVYRENSDGPLFSPMSLALAAAATPVVSGSDYTLTSPGSVTVSRGSSVTVNIGLVLTGSGTVTFTDVLGLPQGVTKSPFSPSSCSGSCSTSVILTASSSAVPGPYRLTVTTSAVLTSPSAAAQCIARSTTVDLTVSDQAPGIVNVLKRGTTDAVPGSCTVTSDPVGIDCGNVCSATFRPVQSPVTLTGRETDPNNMSLFSGWVYPGCTSAAPCKVQINEGATDNVTALCDRLVHLTVSTAGPGNVTRDRLPLSGVACGNDCYIVNDVVELTANPTGTSRFVQWSPNCVPSGPPSGPQKCKVTLRDSTTVTATFNAQGPLTVVNLPLGGRGTVTSDQAGNDGQRISCPPTCERTFDVGVSVTLREAISDNSIFVGWQPPTCADFLARGVPRDQCTVTVVANGSTVDAWFAGTPQQAFVARLYLHVLPGIRPTAQNVDDLVRSVEVAPLLSVRALIDAFYDGPSRPPFSSQDYVKVVFRTLLWREPTLTELNDLSARLDGASASNRPQVERDIRTSVIDEPPLSAEFTQLINAVFPVTVP